MANEGWKEERPKLIENKENNIWILVLVNSCINIISHLNEIQMYKTQYISIFFFERVTFQNHENIPLPKDGRVTN